MINRNQLDNLINKQIDKGATSVDEDIINVFEAKEEYKQRIQDIYTSIIHAEYDYEDDNENGRSYDFIYDFKYQAKIAVNKYERNELLKGGVESLLADYKDDIAHLVTGIREITDALVKANIIIKQQAKEIERLVDLSNAESAGYIKEEK